MIFERRKEQLAPLMVFIRRLAISIGLSGILIMITLTFGILGYHFIARFAWIDAILNASMILGGMGPIGELPTPEAKLFASMYALFCGLIFVAAMGIVISPVVHRMLHWFHLDGEDWF